MSDFAPVFIDQPRQLEELCRHLAQQSVIGLDTEFISEGRYEPELCLVQLSTPEGIWIVDPLAVGEMAELWRILTAETVELVTVAARQEIKFCTKGAGRPPAKVLDLQVAAGLLGFGFPLSHTNLVLRLLNTRVHGGESFTDWRRRPLTPIQLEYAADDVRYLLAMRQKLLQKGEKEQRQSWVDGECAALLAVASRDEEKWMVAGSARLGRRQLAALHEVWRWRDAEARRVNQPSSRILSDTMLVEIAKRSPSSVEDLFAIRGLDRRLLRNGEKAIMEALERARQLSEEALPVYHRREDPPQVNVITKLLSVAANGLAAENGIDPALLATTADLQELVRWYLAGQPEPLPQAMSGWRGEILGAPLMGFLEGKNCVRVANVKRANPLVFEKYPGQ
jgi:ribonuclease D